jgi:hypothetical protein
MTHILEHIAKTLEGKFCPANLDEYFALRLAHHLGEPGAAAFYAILVSQYPLHNILSALSKMNGSATGRERPGRILQGYLNKNGTNGTKSIPRPRLLAIRVQRRIIAVAVFEGTDLKGHRVLHLSAEPSAAAASVAGLIKQVLSDEDCNLATIEPAPERADILRAALHRAVAAEVQSWGISLWEISVQTLLSGFSYPPLKNRPHMRDLMIKLWPHLLLKPAHICALDALAIGLFVQTERLLNNF